MGVFRGGTHLKEVGSWEEILAPWGLSCLGLFVCLPLLSSFFLFLSYLSSPPFPNTMKRTTWLDTFQLWCSAYYGLKSNEARSPWTMSSDSTKQKKFSLLLSDFFCPFVSATDSLNNNIEQLSRVFTLQHSSPTSPRQLLGKSRFHDGRREGALVCMSHPQVPRVVNALVSTFHPGSLQCWSLWLSHIFWVLSGLARDPSLPCVLSGHVFHLVSILGVPRVAASGSIIQPELPWYSSVGSDMTPHCGTLPATTLKLAI